MQDNRIVKSFSAPLPAGQGRLLPYLTAGFPDRGSFRRLAMAADQCGATALEIGFPYSDSIADGPVIQESFYHVLDQGHRVKDTFSLIADVREKVSCGLIAMVSYSIVHRLGLEAFLGRAAEAGFDGVIMPDLPIEESQRAREQSASANLCHIGLVAPTTVPPRRKQIAENSTGFVYQVAVAGTTGERSALPEHLPDEVAGIRQISGLPVCVGFGVSQPEHVRAVCSVADGAIVGSAIVKRIQDGMRSGLNGDDLVHHVQSFISELMAGTRLEHVR